MTTMKVIVSYNTNSHLGIVWLPVSMFPNYANNMMYKMLYWQYHNATTAANRRTQNFVLHILWTDSRQKPHSNRMKSNAISSKTRGWIPCYYLLITDVKYITPGVPRHAIPCLIYFKFHRQPPSRILLQWVQRYPHLPLLGPSYQRRGLQRYAGGHRRGPRGLCDSIAYVCSQSNRLRSHSGTVGAGCRCYGGMSFVSISQCSMADIHSTSQTEYRTKMYSTSSIFVENVIV